MATRTWSEQRAELLAHVEELRQRAQHYHARATRLDLAATVLLGAIQLADDGLAHGDPEAWSGPHRADAGAGLVRRPRRRAAHIPTLRGLVCVVCRAERAAQLEAALNAGNAFEWPVEGRVLRSVAAETAARDHAGSGSAG